jgi:general secretion pathway protein C
MEALIKKYFWTTNLIFIVVAAWLLSNAINAVITLKMRTIPSMTKSAPKGHPSSSPRLPAEDNQVILDRNYFGSAMALKTENLNGPALNEGGAANLLSDGQQSSLRATVVGTIVASDERWSMAVITDQGSSKTDIYRVGDPFMGEATVSGIYSLRVYVLRNGVHEYLELQEKGAKAKIPLAHAVASAMPQTDGGGGDTVNVRQLGVDRYAIDRGEIDKTLTNLNTIAMQARIVPSFVNGEADGFKLFAIRPGSLYSKMGIENGDVIQKINGFPMNSPDKALEVYQKLKTSNSIEVELTRQGQKKRLTYQIN